jgi:hypothetical protein
MSGDAEYYHAHKGDDTSEWGEGERSPKSARRRLAAMISIRLSPGEARLVRAAAAALDESVSTFVRQAALLRARSPHLAQGLTATATSGAGSPILSGDHPTESANVHALSRRPNFATHAEGRAG